MCTLGRNDSRFVTNSRFTQVPATTLPSRFERPQRVTGPVDAVLNTADKGAEFTLNYDKLVIAVGCYSQSNADLVGLCSSNTNLFFILAFGIPGVKEHAYFLKDVRDARAIRLRVLECPCRSLPR